MANRTLIKDAIVLTQDPAIGEIPRADVLVEGDRIAAVGPNLAAADARVIDAAGDILIPGFVDTHRHTWETSIRTSAPDFALITYFGSILDKFAPHYRPDDVYAANLSGGQKKLLEFARTLMIRPRVVLLDEPAAGVNRTLMRQLAGHIEEQCREHGVTFLIVEHDMDLVARLCDPVIVMNQGARLCEGSFSEVQQDPTVLDAYLGSQMR